VHDGSEFKPAKFELRAAFACGRLTIRHEFSRPFVLLTLALLNRGTTMLQTVGAVTAIKKRAAKKVAAKKKTKKTAKEFAFGEYMPTPEAAAYLHLSRQFLEIARYKGDDSGPPYVKLERAVRYRKVDLDAWMTKHLHAADKPI
jgi:predicted DNA-binding transcriptional regulator AlpA